MGKEQDLVLGACVYDRRRPVAHFSNLHGDFPSFAMDAIGVVPPNFKWFSLSWDRIMLVYRISEGDVIMLAAHECLGRAQAQRLLSKLLDDYKSAKHLGTSACSARMEKKLRNVVMSMKGEVPPRPVLMLYPGAPKIFLTREEQHPEIVDHKGGQRLQKALEEIDNSDDDFGFSFSRKPESKTSAGSVNDSEEFTFTFPQKPSAALLYTSPHPRILQAAAASAAPKPQNQNSKPVSGIWSKSPGISSDFSRMGAKVSPEEADSSAATALKEGISYVYEAINSQRFFPAMSMDYSAMKKQSFNTNMSSQYGGTVKDARPKGNVGTIAPSGLSWEDEIASQLAAAGIKVSSRDEPDPSESRADIAQARAALGARPVAMNTRSTAPRPSLFSKSGGGGGGGFGLSRLTQGIKKRFNLQTDQDRLIG